MTGEIKQITQKLSLSIMMAVALPSIALAADDYADGAHGDAHYAEVEGLPQLDFTTYTPQLFWMFAVFALLYIAFAKKALPDISSTIENRKNHIQSDLESAEKLTAEADAVHDAYQANIAKAQTEATEAIKSTEMQAKAQADEAMENFRQKSEATILETEHKVEASKQTAMNDMNQIVIDTAVQAVEKIIGVKADPAQLETIVQNISNIPSSKKSKAA